MPPKRIQISYVRGIVGLMLWYMHRVMSVGRIPFATALADYADIYRKTAFFNLEDTAETARLRPQWLAACERLEAVFAANLAAQGSSGPVEEQCLALLWPHLEERIDRGFPLVEYADKATFGCFYCRVDGPVVDLHFTNTVMPAAPFSAPADLARDLHALARHCRQMYPEATQIKCGSWLNAYPPFRRLFPASWKDSGEPKSYNSLGWWGQFLRHDGDFHVRSAEQFRQTGEFPYKCTFHQCALVDLEAHLREA